jgi:molybdopterin converting factor subunit 1
MKLQLLYFGIVRERLGLREESREIASGATVGELLDELAESHGIFALGAGSIRIAVNREYVEKDHVLADGDEVAVIPPVAGGSTIPPADDSRALVANSDSPWQPSCWPFPAARGH